MESKGTSFELACKEALNRKKKNEIDNGSCFYSSVKTDNPFSEHSRLVGWLIPLKHSSRSTLRVKIENCESDIFTIGRGSQCNYQLDQNMFEEDDENLKHDKISRVHISLVRDCGKLILYNKSANGTYVNGIKVDRKLLEHGDRIGVLKEDFEICYFQENIQ